MTNEQLKAILDNAPESATHIDSELDYWRALSEDECILMSTQYSTIVDQQYPLRSLADIREILALRDENKSLRARIERQQQIITGLEEWVSGIADTHDAIPDWIQQSARSLLAQQANKG